MPKLFINTKKGQILSMLIKETTSHNTMSTHLVADKLAEIDGWDSNPLSNDLGLGAFIYRKYLKSATRICKELLDQYSNQGLSRVHSVQVNDVTQYYATQRHRE